MTHLLQLLLVHHEHIVLQCDDDIAVRTEFEVVSDDVRLVLADLVVIGATLLNSLKVPCVPTTYEATIPWSTPESAHR
jgi:hypothetical protein